MVARLLLCLLGMLLSLLGCCCSSSSCLLLQTNLQAIKPSSNPPVASYLPVLQHCKAMPSRDMKSRKYYCCMLRCNPAKVEAHLKTVVLCVVLPEGCCVNLHNSALHERLCSDLQSCGSMHQPTPTQQSIISIEQHICYTRADP